MPSRKRAKKKIKLRLRRGPVLMALAALWLGYRALTSPSDLGKLTRFIPDSTQIAPAPAKSSDPVGQLLKQASAMQGKIDEEAAALEDIGSSDGISRLPATASPTVAFDRLTAHCPSLGNLRSDTWIEIDEMGQVLSLESKDSGARPTLADCQFEPYRDATGRPLSVRALYTVAK